MNRSPLKSVSQLTKCRDDLQRMLRQMTVVRDLHAAEVASIKADTTRNSEYILNKVTETKKRSLAEIGKPLGELRALVDQVHIDLPYWRQTQFLLSQQRFHKDDAGLENATRARHLAELSAMPNGLLQMTFELAKREGNLPLIYQCYLAGQGREKTAGWRGLDLRGIEIPEQAAALDLIAECTAAKGEADFYVSEMNETMERRVGNPLQIARTRVKQAIDPVLSFDTGFSGAAAENSAADVADMPDSRPQDRMAAARTAHQAPAVA